HEQGRPDDSVEAEDVLPHQVEIRRPEALEPVGIVQVPGRADVVGQGVDPDVDHVARMARNRDPPLKGGPADGEVLHPALDELDHLVPPALGLDELRMPLDVLEEDRKSTRLNSSHVKISYAVF